MKSLKDYYLFEDEDQFVSLNYKTTEETNDADGVELAPPVNQSLNKEIQNNPEDILPGGIDAKIVGELRLYSETSQIFNERKRKIAESFKSRLSEPEINANRIKYTKIFEYYINHLITYYKKNVDENFKINISSKEELKRQIADDFVMLLKNMEIIPTI
jgi:hypothetical protein